MEVEHHGPPLPDIDILDPQPRQREGRQPEIAASSDRKVHAQKTGGADRKFHQARGPVPPDFVRDARCAGLPVSVVVDRVRARVIAESLLEQDLVGPALGPADREIRRPIAGDRVADGILDPHLRLTDIGPEFARTQAIDIFVPVAVARDLVPLRGNLAHDAGMVRRDLAQDEKCRPRKVIAEKLQQPLHALLDPALEAFRAQRARSVTEDRGVVVLLDIDAESVGDHGSSP